MNPELNDLYQEIILDHNRRPRNCRRIEKPTHFADGSNPVCGDEVQVFMLVRDGVIADVSFSGEGCAISKASASLMTLRLKGRPVGEAREEIARVHRMLTSREELQPAEADALGDIAALQGVRQFPARIKCATLSWHAAEAALAGEKATTTE